MAFQGEAAVNVITDPLLHIQDALDCVEAARVAIDFARTSGEDIDSTGLTFALGRLARSAVELNDEVSQLTGNASTVGASNDETEATEEEGIDGEAIDLYEKRALAAFNLFRHDTSANETHLHIEDNRTIAINGQRLNSFVLPKNRKSNEEEPSTPIQVLNVVLKRFVRERGEPLTSDEIQTIIDDENLGIDEVRKALRYFAEIGLLIVARDSGTRKLRYDLPPNAKITDARRAGKGRRVRQGFLVSQYQT